MSHSRIPKQTISVFGDKVPVPKAPIGDQEIVFSFEMLEFNDFFNLDCSCPAWSIELFELLKMISMMKQKELVNYHKGTFRIHLIENSSPPCAFPEGIDLKSCYQIRLDKSNGGIHGLLFENVFHVFWLDPLHNLYPQKKYGGLRKIKRPKEWCEDARDSYLNMKAKITELMDENKELWEALAKT